MWTKCFIYINGYIYRASFELHSLMAIHVETGEVYQTSLFDETIDYEFCMKVYKKILKREKRYYSNRKMSK